MKPVEFKIKLNPIRILKGLGILAVGIIIGYVLSPKIFLTEKQELNKIPIKEQTEGVNANKPSEQITPASSASAFTENNLRSLIDACDRRIHEINRNESLGVKQKGEQIQGVNVAAIMQYEKVVNEILAKPFDQIVNDLNRKITGSESQLMDEFENALSSRLTGSRLSVRFPILVKLHQRRDYLFKISKKILDNQIKVKTYPWFNAATWKEKKKEYFSKYSNSSLSTAQKNFLDRAMYEMDKIGKEFTNWYLEDKKTLIEWLEESKKANKKPEILTEIKSSINEPYKSEFLNCLRKDIYCIILNPNARKRYLDENMESNFNELKKYVIYPITAFILCIDSELNTSDCFMDEILNRGKPTLNYYAAVKKGYQKVLYDDFINQYE